MSPTHKCSLCHTLLADSAEGERQHMKRYHALTVGKKYIPMDPVDKAVIVRRVENRLGSRLIDGTRVKEREEITQARALLTNAEATLEQASDPLMIAELEAMISDLQKIIGGAK